MGTGNCIFGNVVQNNNSSSFYTYLYELMAFYEAEEFAENLNTNITYVNKMSYKNLANSEYVSSAIYTTDHFANALSVMVDGKTTDGNSADSWDGTLKETDYWGLSFNGIVALNKVVYISGHNGASGGWFESGLKAQVRQNGRWLTVQNLNISPDYLYNNTTGPDKAYTFTFDDTYGDAVRIIGKPVYINGYKDTYSSIKEFEAYFYGAEEVISSSMSFDKAKPIDNTVLVNNRKSFKRIEKQSIYSKVFYTADNL